MKQANLQALNMSILVMSRANHGETPFVTPVAGF